MSVWILSILLVKELATDNEKETKAKGRPNKNGGDNKSVKENKQRLTQKIKNNLTSLVSKIKNKWKSKLSYRDSVDINNPTKLKPPNYNSNLFRKMVDLKDRPKIMKPLKKFMEEVQYDNFESMIAISRSGKVIGGIVKGDRKGVKATKKILKKANEGNILATAHNHVRSSSPLASTADVEYHVKNNLGKYAFPTSNENGVGIIKNNNKNWTKDKIDELDEELEKYNDKIREDFEKIEEEYLTEKWNDLKRHIITYERYYELYYERLAEFKLQNTEKYAKKLDEVLKNNDIRFGIFK